MKMGVLLPLLLSVIGCVPDGGSGIETNQTNDLLQPVLVPVFDKQEVPSSQRSRAAIGRVVPSLVRDLQTAGLAYGNPVFIRIFKEERELEFWVEKGFEYRTKVKKKSSKYFLQDSEKDFVHRHYCAEMTKR